MFWLLLSVLSTQAHAGGLDLVEVGGMWGSPGATNPTALWWNPAGIAMEGGTQFLVEGAPVFAKVVNERENPDYGTLTPNGEAPTEYNYGGKDTLTFNGVAPFVGVTSDFGVKGLGFGVGLAVPIAKGGVSDSNTGANRYAINSGNIQALDFIAGGGYRIMDKLAIGVSGQLVSSTWSANTDTESYSALYDEAFALLGAFGTSGFQEGHFENPGYSANLDFKQLHDTAITFGTGIHVTPLDNVDIALSYNHGMKLEHKGDLDMVFQCPPDWDVLGQVGAQSKGICDLSTGQASMSGEGQVGYSLPGRFHGAVVVNPTPKSRIELMGAYILWSQFTDYNIKTFIDADQIDPNLDDETREEAAALVSQDRKWARDNKNNFFVGIDGKVQAHDLLMLGLRASFDKSAVPDEALSANNWDADTLMLNALAVVTPKQQFSVGLSFGQYFIAKRTNDESAYALALFPDARKEDRYFYPESRGTYSGSITRLGISLKGTFGDKDDNDKPRW